MQCTVDELFSSYISKKKKVSSELPNARKADKSDMRSKVVGEVKMGEGEMHLHSLLQEIMKEDCSLIPTDSALNREYVNTIRFFQYAAQQKGKQTMRNMYTQFSQSPFYIPPTHPSPVTEKPISAKTVPLLNPLCPSFFTITHSSHSPSTQSLFLAVLHTIRNEFDVTIIEEGLFHGYTFSV